MVDGQRLKKGQASVMGQKSVLGQRVCILGKMGYVVEQEYGWHDPMGDVHNPQKEGYILDEDMERCGKGGMKQEGKGIDYKAEVGMEMDKEADTPKGRWEGEGEREGKGEGEGEGEGSQKGGMAQIQVGNGRKGTGDQGDNAGDDDDHHHNHDDHGDDDGFDALASCYAGVGYGKEDLLDGHGVQDCHSRKDTSLRERTHQAGYRSGTSYC